MDNSSCPVGEYHGKRTYIDKKRDVHCYHCKEYMYNAVEVSLYDPEINPNKDLMNILRDRVCGKAFDYFSPPPDRNPEGSRKLLLNALDKTEGMKASHREGAPHSDGDYYCKDCGNLLGVKK